MREPPTTIRLAAAVDDYAAAVLQEVVRLLGRTRPSADAHDIATDVVETFLRAAPATMASYPNPAVYAAVSVRHAAIDFDRRERVQRGEGVRLVAGPDGRLSPRRRTVSGNVAVGDGTSEVLDLVADPAEPLEASVVRRHDAAILLERCLVGLSGRERFVLRMVDGEGHTVQEVAARLGLRRETTSRQLTRARTTARTTAATTARTTATTPTTRVPLL